MKSKKNWENEKGDLTLFLLDVLFQKELLRYRESISTTFSSWELRMTATTLYKRPMEIVPWA